MLLGVAPLGRSVHAAELFEDFSSGVGSWLASPGWVLVEKADGNQVYRGDANSDTFTRNTALNLGESWRLEVDVRFRRYYADDQQRGLAGFALFPALDSGVQFEANLGHRTNSFVQMDAQWFNPTNSTWRNVLQTVWLSNPSPAYRMQLTRPAGSDRIIFRVTSTDGFSNRVQSGRIPLDVLNRMKVAGFRVNSAQVEFDNLRVVMPFALPDPPTITQQPTGQTVAVGTPVTLQVAATDSRPLTYQWWRSQFRVVGATNATYEMSAASLANAGTYTVVVSNDENTTTSSPAVLTVINASVKPAAWVKTNGIPAEGFPLELTVPADIAFRLQETSDLKTWSDLTNSVGSGMPLEFLAPHATDQSRALYRLLLP